MDTRTRILETAARLFYQQGYNSTGINQVIKEAGVAKASLYEHFPSKEDLLAEYLKLTSANTMQELRGIAAKFTTPREKIIAIFDSLIKHTRQNEYQGCHFLNTSAEISVDNSKIKSIIKKQKNNIRELFAEILKPAGKEGVADELYILFDAGLVTSKVFADAWTVKKVRAMVEKFV